MITAAGKGTRFRPCIDLHEGEVKQIVGGTLAGDSSCTTNFVSPLPPEHYADLYRRNGLTGGHLIKLGGGNDEAARSALACWRGAFVIVTSWLFPAKEFSLDRLRRLSEEVGREKLVVDVSCRKRDGRWFVAIDKWQTITDMEVNGGMLSAHIMSTRKTL
ncbi:MAG: 1--5-imidazole-4-carboxamide isomerase [Olpidium bornovanus]|uniref:1--5-imidazole-4-carboxamide isomerase n=1 Tax=Olpidium bornovanus TaxID=278681 RepID=A0A8H8DDZ7_9FUNG|nr:MAG: 1--5-imidazole-4-carboxamide isomerase [Olpidium bornovanus]